MYDEQPKTTPRNPVFSSCMTNQASPDMWRFQNCDLDRLPKSNQGEIECIAFLPYLRTLCKNANAKLATEIS